MRRHVAPSVHRRAAVAYILRVGLSDAPPPLCAESPKRWLSWRQHLSTLLIQALRRASATTADLDGTPLAWEGTPVVGLAGSGPAIDVTSLSDGGEADGSTTLGGGAGSEMDVGATGTESVTVGTTSSLRGRLSACAVICLLDELTYLLPAIRFGGEGGVIADSLSPSVMQVCTPVQCW